MRIQYTTKGEDEREPYMIVGPFNILWYPLLLVTDGSALAILARGW